MRRLILSTLAIVSIGVAKAETARMLATSVIDVDAASLAAAPWLNQSHFIVIRSTDDPVCKWIEKVTGKSFSEVLKKRPLLVYGGYKDATYFVSGEEGNRALLLDTWSLKDRDPLAAGLRIAVAELPEDADKIFWIHKVDEDRSRLGERTPTGSGANK